jgi:hypothetical protein
MINFMQDLNFTFDAVPDNYIGNLKFRYPLKFQDHPPNSISAVRENLAIVEQILSSFNATQRGLQLPGQLSEKQKYIQKRVVKLFKDLKDQIYPALDEFIIKAELCLLDQFDCLDIPFDILTIRSLLTLTQVRPPA